MKENFTKPVICPSDYDMKKKWFVYFRWTDHFSQKRYPIRKRADLNTIEDKTARIREAKNLCKILLEQLESGWNPITGNTETEQINLCLVDMLKANLETKKSSLKPKSIRSYGDVLNMFESWLKHKGYDLLYPKNFTHVMCRQYMNFLLVDKKYTGKSHNTQLGIIKSWFTNIQQLELIDKNPFDGIKELPEDHGKNFPFTIQEQAKLKEYFFTHNQRMYYACQFLYYLLIRPSELVKLKVRDINFENKTIILHSVLSKNRRQQSVTIPKSLEVMIYEMGLDKAPKDHFIFGFRLATRERPTVGINGIGGLHLKACRDKTIMIGSEKTFYSWKHTGACALYMATKDPYVVMAQARHSTISITMIYLRSLGLTVNDKIREVDY